MLTLDLDAVERNITRLQRYCDDHGIMSWPHVKTHKLPQIADLQLRAGAAGLTCQKLGEADVMVAAGCGDILVTFPLVGAIKAERFAALAGRARMGVAADSEAVARSLSTALAREGATAEFLVECDTGSHRTGVQTPEQAADLAELVDRLPGLRFGGLMTHPLLPGSGPWLRAARRAVEQRGLEVRRVSGGGTAVAYTTHEVGEITELRAGTYVYGDRACLGAGLTLLEDCALRVSATVVSRPTRKRAVLDAGSKTLTSDPARGVEAGTFGLVLEFPETRIYALSEEHAHVAVGDCDPAPELGDTVTIIPNHACGTTNLHDEVVVHRRGDVVGVWRVAARGKVR